MMTHSTGSLADSLFGKAKRAVIGALFAQPDTTLHLRELARVTQISPTAINYEVRLLADAGLILIKKDGNRLNIRANPSSPLFEELRSIARKTTGMADVVRAELEKLPGIKQAFIFGSMASGTDNPNSDIDLLVVTDEDIGPVYEAVSELEQLLRRAIHLNVYSQKEWEDSQNTPVMESILNKPRLLIVENGTDTGKH
ncbi:MAG: nucleotidyltransferase domain-containing protein [Deltaproteobacteria bacterium]|nr:nucleotidyltransferase domain-containing protein [Deltaproteobacteria bacterium]